MVHKIPSCAFHARPGNSQTLFRWMFDGNTAALQYFRFEHLHSQGSPIPIHLIRYGPRSLVCPALTASPIVLAYGLTECRSSGLTAGSFPSLHRSSGKSFWEGGVREGRTFFQKGFPPRKHSSLSSNLQASAALAARCSP